MYSKAPESFEELLAPIPLELRRTAEWIRQLIHDEFPQLEETLHGGTKVAMALYSVGGQSVVLGIEPGLHYVKLYLHHPDRLGKTQFRLEGRGKHMRHIKFTAPPEDRREELIALARIPVETVRPR